MEAQNSQTRGYRELQFFLFSCSFKYLKKEVFISSKSELKNNDPNFI